MITPLEKRLQEIIAQAVKNVFELDFDINLERPKVAKFGDLSTNVAMTLGKYLKLNPLEVAEVLVKELQSSKDPLWSKLDIVKPGFINFFLTDQSLIEEVKNINKEGENYGHCKVGKGEKINVEFISANPTGPMTLPNGRGGFMGDTLANVLTTQGYKVEREFYLNDAGNQIDLLGRSVAALHDVIRTEENFYKGDYLKDLAWEFKDDAMKAGVNFLELGRKVAQKLIAEEIKPSVEKHMKISFDTWYSEYDNLYKTDKVKNTLAELEKAGVTKKEEGAVWLKTTDFGDDEDRVLVKSDGSYSYFLVDIAYHLDKLKRGFKKLINFWGADHHGHVKRMKAALKALGYEDVLDIVVMQLVTLTQDGKEVRMSKRAGNFVLIDDLIKEVGLDVTRFFFLMYGANSHMEFDLSLAKDKSDKNPVYYVQYAHARITSILDKAKGLKEVQGNNLSPVAHELATKLVNYPSLLEVIASTYELQKLPTYLIDLAKSFHSFYAQDQVIEDNQVSQQKLELLQATQSILKQGLTLMGVTAPDKM